MDYSLILGILAIFFGSGGFAASLFTFFKGRKKEKVDVSSQYQGLLKEQVEMYQIILNRCMKLEHEVLVLRKALVDNGIPLPE